MAVEKTFGKVKKSEMFKSVILKVLDSPVYLVLLLTILLILSFLTV